MLLRDADRSTLGLKLRLKLDPIHDVDKSTGLLRNSVARECKRLSPLSLIPTTGAPVRVLAASSCTMPVSPVPCSLCQWVSPIEFIGTHNKIFNPSPSAHPIGSLLSILTNDTALSPQPEADLFHSILEKFVVYFIHGCFTAAERRSKAGAE